MAVNHFEFEVDMYEQVLSAFPSMEFAFAEVPFRRKRVDLIFSSQSARFLYAVELKLTDWRHALKQALVNQIFAQYSYVALPDRVIQALGEPRLNTFERNNVGLLSVGDNTVIILKPRRSEYFNKRTYRDVKSELLALAGIRERKQLEAVIDGIAKGKRTTELLQTRSH